MAYYREYLISEYEKKCCKNPSYSLRAFSKFMGIDVSILSKVLSKKMPLSYKAGMQASDALNLSPEKHATFMTSIAMDRHERGLKRSHPELRKWNQLTSQSHEFAKLEEDHFSVIRDWYHFAILELSFLPHHQDDPEWISGQLGISVVVVRQALSRLESVGLLKREQGRLRKLKKRITTSTVRRGNAVKAHQAQILEKAKVALMEQSVDRRVMTSMTLPMAADKLELARKKIEDFAEQLAKEMSADPNHVFQLQVSLFPLTKNSEERSTHTKFRPPSLEGKESIKEKNTKGVNK